MTAWTCPFCPLACDHLAVRSGPDGLALESADCARAQRGLAAVVDHGQALVDGRPASLDEAVATAAKRLAAARQPLLAGLGCDVAGARALYPLAAATGAVMDTAGGDAFAAGIRALQDRGQVTATLAEVKARADLLVFVGAPPLAAAPLLFERLGPGERVILDGDPYDTLAMLGALIGGRTLRSPPEALVELAARLQQAKFAVFVAAPADLPAPAALAIESVHRIVIQLNRSTRAAALWIGGGNGAATANQVFTWLSGLPLRTRAGPRGLEHEPLLYGAQRMLDDHSADALLWVSAFDAEAHPPAGGLPLVALAHPAQGATCAREGAVFIPVATPGIHDDGHLFRTDGTVLMPLNRVRAAALPTVAEVARRIHGALTA